MKVGRIEFGPRLSAEEIQRLTLERLNRAWAKRQLEIKKKENSAVGRPKG